MLGSGLQLEEQVAALMPWTAGYVRMRALSDPDVFLVSDLGVRNGLKRAGLPVDPSAAAAAAQAWRPWRSYAQMHLWALTAHNHEEEGTTR